MNAKHLCCGVAVAIALAGSARAVELIKNGDFETGNFSHWTNLSLAGSSGSWYISAPGAFTPFSGSATAPNANGGNYYAVTDQGGPGTHVILQPFKVPLTATSVVLSYDMFANDSDSGPIVSPFGLDYAGDPNQHVRVDILYGDGNPFSTVGLDIAGNFYLGVDPQATNPNPYTSYSFDITSIVAPGSTYWLRFAEVDNQLFLNLGVDNVSVQSIPEPVTATLTALLATIVGLVGIRRC